jgi:riboflavin kinase/FMN adenylyltransferase
LLPAVITFRNNPKKPEKPNKTEDIISFEEKITLLDSFGIVLAVIIDFSEHFSKINGRAFLEALNKYLCPAYIGLGGNFHCGYQRDTDAQAFKALAESLGITTEIVPPVLEGGIPVSSSRIREALRALRYEEASLLLGRSIK